MRLAKQEHSERQCVVVAWSIPTDGLKLGPEVRQLTSAWPPGCPGLSTTEREADASTVS